MQASAFALSFPRICRWRPSIGLAPRSAGALAALSLLLAALAGPVGAQGEPPARVGRVALADGAVQLLPAQRADGQATVAIEQPRNWPLATGDQIHVGPNGRAELTVGSTLLRLGERSHLQILQLDDQALRLQLLDGSLALRVRTDESSRSTEVVAGAYRMRADAPGLFRIDADAGAISATAWQSAWRVAGPDSLVTLRSGQRLILDPTGRQWRFAPPASDRFASWAMVDDTPVARSDLVSPEMTGQEDLARHGDWLDSEEWGPVWLPRNVGAEWAPYREGRWVWVAPWGWTWVDAAPWGFAPFHYGRWVQWRQRWGWVPGRYQARPVYAPALVIWSGPAHDREDPRHGGGRAPVRPPSWRLLPPHEPYAPPYRGPRDPGGAGHPAFRLPPPSRVGAPRPPDVGSTPWQRAVPDEPFRGEDARRRIPPQPRGPVAADLPAPPAPAAAVLPAPTAVRGFPSMERSEPGAAPSPAGRSVFAPPVQRPMPPPAVNTAVQGSALPAVSTPQALPAPVFRGAAPGASPAPGGSPREAADLDLRRRAPEMPRVHAPPAPLPAAPAIQAAAPTRIPSPMGRHDEGRSPNGGHGSGHGGARPADERRFPRGAQ